MLDFNGDKNVMIQVNFSFKTRKNLLLMTKNVFGLKDFHVVSVTSDEIFISFVYEYNKEIKTDLLRSTKDDFYNFKVSLSEFSLIGEKEMDKVYEE